MANMAKELELAQQKLKAQIDDSSYVPRQVAPSLPTPLTRIQTDSTSLFNEKDADGQPESDPFEENAHIDGDTRF